MLGTSIGIQHSYILHKMQSLEVVIRSDIEDKLVNSIAVDISSGSNVHKGY